jgi:hypothetical protein
MKELYPETLLQTLIWQPLRAISQPLASYPAEKLGRAFSPACHRLMFGISGNSTTFTERAKSSATPMVMSAMLN